MQSVLRYFAVWPCELLYKDSEEGASPENLRKYMGWFDTKNELGNAPLPSCSNLTHRPRAISSLSLRPCTSWKVAAPASKALIRSLSFFPTPIAHVFRRLVRKDTVPRFRRGFDASGGGVGGFRRAALESNAVIRVLWSWAGYLSISLRPCASDVREPSPSSGVLIHSRMFSSNSHRGTLPLKNCERLRQYGGPSWPSAVASLLRMLDGLILCMRKTPRKQNMVRRYN